MKNFCEVNIHNLDQFYNDPSGNLYFKDTTDPEADYEVVDGFSAEELKAALVYGDIQMIWLSGPAVAILSEVLDNE